MPASKDLPEAEISAAPPVPDPAENETQSVKGKGSGETKPLPPRTKEDILIGGVYQAIAKLEVVQHQLRRLNEEFDTKLKYDAHKEKIIDHLHEELQEYKNDIFSKHQHSLVSDVIKIIDDIRKLTAHYRSMRPENWDPAKLLEYLEQIPFDLEDMFLLRGISPFTEASRTVDPARQRITKRLPTSDPSQDKLVAVSLRPGYECDGRVLRPELVAVYVYESSDEEAEATHLNE